MNRLRRAVRLCWMAPLLLTSHPAVAAVEVINGVVRDITGDRAATDFQVEGGGTLNGSNVQTGYLLVLGDSTLNLNNAQVSGGAQSAVRLIASSASIIDSTLDGGPMGLELRFTGSGSTAQGSTAVISRSTLSGSDAGVLSAGSRLTLVDSTVTGTGADGVGLRARGGEISVLDSHITGTVNGASILQTPVVPDSLHLVLDNSHVTGQTGSALVVAGVGADPALKTVIDVHNGSTLTGGNGTLLEVSNTHAQMNVANTRLTGDAQVKDQGVLDLSLDQASLTGDVIAEAGSTANVSLANGSLLTGRLDNVAGLAIDDSARWEMTGDSTVGSLALSGGTVKMGKADAFQRLTLGSLSGNGTFMMDADFAQGLVDFLDVTGTASGDHALLVGATGADPVTAGKLHVVHIGNGDAQFSLVGGGVDVGTFRYELLKEGANDWYLAQTTELTPSTGTVLALFNTAPTVWYGELSTLRSRMGELRFNGGQSGGWIRAYGNKYNASTASGVGYKQVQQGLSFGADAPLPGTQGQWLVGVLGGVSESDLALDRGASGRVDSYYLGAYTTWLDPASGYYFDAVLKLNRLRNKAEVNMSDGTRSKGRYHNNGIGTSLEFGRHIKFDDGYFVEPYAQLSGMLMQGKDYTLDNGMRASGDQMRSLLGKLGTTAGRNFDLGDGRVLQPYVRAAYAHEFASNNGVKVNDHRFNNDLSGSRGELGVGVAVSMSERLQLHADFDYSNGERIEQPWGANVGLRYSW